MFLGIDVGTGGTRAVLVDREGRVVASAASDHAPVRSEQIGWAEQQPEDWWRAAREAIARRACRRRPGAAPAQSAIGLTGQMHGAVHAGRGRRRCCAPRSSGATQRTQPQCDWLTEKHRLRAADRADLQPRAAQLHAHQAALGQRATSRRSSRKIAPRPLPQGLRPLPAHRRVRHRRAGGLGHAAARRDASPLVAGSRRGRGDSARAGCPRLFESPEVCARISDDRPRGLTGLAAGTPVVAGAGDQGAGAVGMGISRAGFGLGHHRHLAASSSPPPTAPTHGSQRPPAHLLPRRARAAGT